MAQLCRRHDEFAELNAGVILISFSMPPLRMTWGADREGRFPIHLDPDMRIYQAFGLSRSWTKAYSPSTLLYYMKYILTGRRLPARQGDPAQLGGDFIVDRQRIIRFAHRSRNPTDRPSVDTILWQLRQLES